MSVETSSREFDFGPDRRRWIWLGGFAAVLAILTTLLLLDVGDSEAAVAPPGVPTDFTATPISDGVRLTWNEPLAPGEPEFTFYRVINESIFGDGALVCEVERRFTTCDATTAAGQVVVGQPNEFRIVALFRPIGGTGETVGNSAAAQGQPGRVPSEPRNLEATPADGAVKLTWGAPADLGFPNEVTYRVDDPSRPEIAPYCEGSFATECTISAADEPTPGFRVVAVNTAGPSNHAYIESAPGVRPSAVQNLQHELTVGGVDIRWEAPENPGNPPVEDYVVTTRQPRETVCVVEADADLLCELREQDPGVPVDMQIVPRSALGLGTPELFQVTTGALPSAVRNVQAIPQDGGVTLTWDGAANLGLPGPHDFVVHAENGSQKCSNNEPTCTIEDLENGIEQTFTVFARNGLGIGPGVPITFTPNKRVEASVMDINVAKPGNQTVTIEGKGFPADRRVFAVACPRANNPEDASIDTCDVRVLVPATTDANGNFTVDALWDIPATGLVFEVSAVRSTARAVGTITVDPAADYKIVVRAKGERAEETFSVSIGGTEIGTGTATAEYQDYTFTAPAGSEGGVSVTFTNDFYDGYVDRNLWIDYVKINDKTYESESPTTYTQGAWTAGAGCSPGFRQSERIVCGGTFTYTVLHVDGGEWQPEDPYLPEEPTADEPASNHVIRVRAKGDTGGERFALRIGTDVIGHVAVTNEWRTYRFKLDTLPSGKLALAFMNDSDDGYNDFNLQVDFVRVNDDKYETEDARIYMAGPGPDAACNSGHKQSETLYCAGAFFYADL